MNDEDIVMGRGQAYRGNPIDLEDKRMSELKKYEYAMIDIGQSDSNKKHCMTNCINLAEQADNEIAELKEKLDRSESKPSETAKDQRIRELEAKVEEISIAHNNQGELRYMAEQTIAALQAQIEELKGYANHLPKCGKTKHAFIQAIKCMCGYDNMVAKYPAKQKD